MTQEDIDHHYNKFLGSDNEKDRELENFKIANTFLKNNDWFFISPLFFQGFELEVFLNLSKNNNNDKKKILEVITKKFYNLPRTASFIEGYCNRCKHISPFLKSIEHSLILTFQRDYEGGIKTLIPTIEGILRKYLVNEKGYSRETIQYKVIKKSFELLEADLISNHREQLKAIKDANGNAIGFSETQIENIVRNEKVYYKVWFSFIDDFVKKSFYLKTNNVTITNEINRHSILHEFGDDFNYSFEGYVKIYFLLQFLTWVFLKKEKQSQFNEIDSIRLYEKVISYRNIIKLSEKILYDKHKLMKNYDNYNEQNYKLKFRVFIDEILPKKYSLLFNISDRFYKYLWRKGLN